MEFQKTVGHKKQKEVFLRAVKNDTLHQAYALVGPEHIGKSTLAREAADLIGGNEILDRFVYEDEKGISVEEVRELKAKLSLKSSNGGYKIGIIDHADMISMAASNALLKLLEEPPPRSLIFLVTPNFYKLLPTVRSRVQKLVFGGASEAEVRESVSQYDVSEKDLKDLVFWANGRIGLAIRLAESPELRENYSRNIERYRVLAEGSIKERIKLASELADEDKDAIRRFLHFSAEHWASAPGELGLAKKILYSIEDLEYNLNTRLFLDNLFLT